MAQGLAVSASASHRLPAPAATLRRMSEDLALKVVHVVDGELRERAWDAYCDAFEELRSAAIQRHVMTRAEFDEVMADERVAVYLAERGDGVIVGIATLANDLTSMPLVSPEFFAARGAGRPRPYLPSAEHERLPVPHRGHLRSG